MIFPNLEIEDIVQVGDKTRLNAVKSFVSKGSDPITKVEIRPFAASDWIDVTGSGSDDWFLDFEYDSDDDYDVSVRVTTSDGAETPDINTETKTKVLEVVTRAQDALFSYDSELLPHEPDVLRWVPKGRNSFLNVHRQAQRDVLAWLDENGYTDKNGERLTKAAIVDREEVRYWSAAHTLMLIFKGISNSVDDVFMEKSKFYDSLARSHRQRAILRLDITGDGEIDSSEFVRVSSVGMIRR